MQGPTSSFLTLRPSVLANGGQGDMMMLKQESVVLGDAILKIEEDDDDEYVPPPATEANSLPTPAGIRAKKGANDPYYDFFRQKVDLEGLDMEWMWNLPFQTREGLTATEAKSVFDGSPTALFYIKCCNYVRNVWDCAAEDCIPEPLRALTPYSLAMMDKLRQFAKHTRGNLDEAQALLMDMRLQRDAEMKDFSHPHFVSTSTGNQPQTEDIIVENVFGLTMQDIAAAIGRRILTQHSNAMSNVTSNVTALAKVTNRTARRKERRLRSQANTERDAATASQQQAELAERMVLRRRSNKVGDIAAALENLTLQTRSGAAKLDKVKGHGLRDVRTIPPEAREEMDAMYRETQLARDRKAQLKKDQRQQQSGEDKAKLKKKQEQKEQHQHPATSMLANEAKNLGIFFSQCQIADGKEGRVANRRSKVLGAGGVSRERNQGDLRMPSERYDFNSLPTLHSIATATSPGELTMLGQLPLPD